MLVRPSLPADILLLHGLGVKLVIVCGAATLVSFVACELAAPLAV